MTWKDAIKKEDTNLTNSVKENIDKIAEEMKKALNKIDIGILVPHRRVADKDELVDMMVKRAIDYLKDNVPKLDDESRSRWDGD